MRVGARPVTGKTSELIGRSRSVPEIHRAIGECRLNSRAAEARKRLRAHGRDLVMTRAPGVAGAEAYSYRIPGGPLTSRELSRLATGSSRVVSGTPAASCAVSPTPEATQLNLLEAAA